MPLAYFFERRANGAEDPAARRAKSRRACRAIILGRQEALGACPLVLRDTGKPAPPPVRTGRRTVGDARRLTGPSHVDPGTGVFSCQPLACVQTRDGAKWGFVHDRSRCPRSHPGAAARRRDLVACPHCDGPDAARGDNSFLFLPARPRWPTDGQGHRPVRPGDGSGPRPRPPRGREWRAVLGAAAAPRMAILGEEDVAKPGTYSGLYPG